MRVFFSAGEASGDAYAAALLREVKQLAPEQLRLRFEGVGGKQLTCAGASVVVDSSRWGAISILQSLKVAPRIVGGYSKAKRALRNGSAGLFIPIDFGYMNVKLARYAKEKGWKVLYFIPPGSWRRHKQGKDLPAVAHEIVTPFPWSADILQGMRASVHFFGHPLKQMILDAKPHAGERTSVAVLPGSRMHEIKENLPAIADAVSGCPGVISGGVTPVGCFDNATSGRDNLQHLLEFAVASSVDAQELKQRWRALAPDRTGDVFTQGDTYGVLSRARAAIVCSGTATLEAALCGCPLVVMYRFGKMTEIEARLRRVRPKFISLPNILLDRHVVPELIQHQATPDNIRSTLDAIIVDGQPRRNQLEAFIEIDNILGPADAITRTAELALRMMS